MTRHRVLLAAALAVALSLVAASCGDDDDDAVTDTTAAASDTTVAATDTTTASGVDPAAALDELAQSMGPDTVSSGPVAAPPGQPFTEVALLVSGTQASVHVFDPGLGRWEDQQTITLAPSVIAGSSVPSADLTGSGWPSFLVDLQGADAVENAVIATTDDGGTWESVPFQGGGDLPAGPVVPTFGKIVDGSLVTSQNDCVPDCASGTDTEVTWVYQDGTFVPEGS
ncbi:MAG: hypothetical protein IPM45_11580 [Acidimicrobiales bacterium]|nr:hypothetical protein [Acidimicrobiales bacterium]